LLTSDSESLIAAKEVPEIPRTISVRAASNHDFTANRNHLAFEAAYATIQNALQSGSAAVEGETNA